MDTMQIVECVPNYSVGNNSEIIEQIVAPFKNKENVKLVNVESDDNYNRSVVTIIGAPDEVVSAVVESVIIATKLIDMNFHQGEHKRMGATDVVPFIPIKNMSIEQCVALSEVCAKKIFEATNIPVFLYSNSAKKDQCINLPDIRKGEYEGMKEKLKDPYWKPDFGSDVHPTAGVVGVGCRPLLIAFNIDIDTDSKEIATYIAKAVRYSGGGYRCIQAGPAHLEDKHIYQVTMNVTDYTKTSIYRAFEAVKMEAKRFDVSIIGSEFVGLVSLDSIKDVAAYYLHKLKASDVDLSLEEVVDIVNKHLLLHGFNKEKVIEYYV